MACGAAELTDLMGYFNDLQSLIFSTNDLYAFAIAVPGFLVSTVLIILKLPLAVPEYIVAQVMCISPPIGTIMAIISPFISAGIYAAILVKAFEVIGNRFRDV